MHKLLSNGFLSQEANRANPGGFSLFMFHPRTVDLGGKGRNELLREYLGMDVDETTLEYYAKQGFFTPTNPHDLRVQLQTALSMLELLTCANSIATPGLRYVLQPSRWTRMTTILNDRFKTEKDFGAKFCYTLDRSLQIFLDRATRWTDMEADGEPNYLRSKAEYLLERLEDGRALSVILPNALLSANTTKKREVKGVIPTEGAKKAKSSSPKDAPAPAAPSKHSNDDTQSNWMIPSGKTYNTLFGATMASLKGWPYFTDNRLAKKGRSQRAPMCIRFQAMGECTQACTLAHLRASDMPDTERRAVEKRVLELYS